MSEDFECPYSSPKCDGEDNACRRCREDVADDSEYVQASRGWTGAVL